MIKHIHIHLAKKTKDAPGWKIVPYKKGFLAQTPSGMNHPEIFKTEQEAKDWVVKFNKPRVIKDSSKPNIHGLFQKQALEKGSKSGIFLYMQTDMKHVYFTKSSAQKAVDDFNNSKIEAGPNKDKIRKDVYNEFQKAKFFEYSPAECKAELEKSFGTKDAKTPQAILAEIKRQRRLEDRSEYGIEDLMQMYGLSKEDAKILENLIKQAMNG